jgi:hypothetical protein
MTTRFAARAAAFGLSAIVTLAMLGSVNFLAAVEPVISSVLAAAGAPHA